VPKIDHNDALAIIAAGDEAKLRAVLEAGHRFDAEHVSRLIWEAAVECCDWLMVQVRWWVGWAGLMGGRCSAGCRQGRLSWVYHCRRQNRRRTPGACTCILR
jgi:hypothetical protein